VERYTDRPNARGMSIDAEDNLYLTEVDHRAVDIISARDRTSRRLVKQSEMTWPDGLSTGLAGPLYVTVDQLLRSAPPNGGRDGTAPPYLLVRFTPLEGGRLGHSAAGREGATTRICWWARYSVGSAPYASRKAREK